MKLSEKLREKVEADLGVTVIDGPTRIYGLKGAAHRWEVKLLDGRELSCEDTMAEAVNTEKLHIIKDGIHPYITVS